jgi:hypothetical protein
VGAVAEIIVVKINLSPFLCPLFSGAAKDPGAGSPDQPVGAGEAILKKATALLMSDELDRTR